MDIRPLKKKRKKKFKVRENNNRIISIDVLTYAKILKGVRRQRLLLGLTLTAVTLGFIFGYLISKYPPKPDGLELIGFPGNYYFIIR